MDFAEIELNLDSLKHLVKGLKTLANYDNDNMTEDSLNFCRMAEEKLETISRLLECLEKSAMVA